MIRNKSTPKPSLTFDWTEFDSPSIAIVYAVAENENVSPVNLPPLYRAIDPDALDAVIDSLTHRQYAPITSVEFGYMEYRILVKENGQGYLFDQHTAV